MKPTVPRDINDSMIGHEPRIEIVIEEIAEPPHERDDAEERSHKKKCSCVNGGEPEDKQCENTRRPEERSKTKQPVLMNDPKQRFIFFEMLAE